MGYRYCLLLFAFGLLHLRVSATGLQLLYRRVQFSPPQTDTFTVEGVVTLVTGDTWEDSLDCVTTSNPTPDIQWRRGSRENLTTIVDATNSLIQTIANGKALVIDDFGAGSLGNYTCIDFSSNDSLTIYITSKNPYVLAVHDFVEIDEGTSGALKAYISGIPKPTREYISWFRVHPNGTLAEILENISSDGRTLFFANAQKSDEGTYNCFAYLNTPASPFSNDTIRLIITPKKNVTFTVQPSSIVLDESSNATLLCTASGPFISSITWMRADGKALSGSSTTTSTTTSGNEMTITSTLRIASIRPEDGGEYFCEAVASGVAAVYSRKANITIVSPEKPTAGNVTASTKHASVITECSPPELCSYTTQRSVYGTVSLAIVAVGTAATAIVILLLTGVGMVIVACVCLKHRHSKQNDTRATWPEAPPQRSMLEMQDIGSSGLSSSSTNESAQLANPTTLAVPNQRVSLTSLPKVEQQYTSLVIGPQAVITGPQAVTIHTGPHLYSSIAVNQDPNYARLQRDSLKRNQSDASTVVSQELHRPAQCNGEAVLSGHLGGGISNGGVIPPVANGGDIPAGGSNSYTGVSNSYTGVIDTVTVNGADGTRGVEGATEHSSPEHEGNVNHGGGRAGTGGTHPRCQRTVAAPSGRIPMRRQCSNTTSTSAPLTLEEGEYPLSLHPSTISTISSVPSSQYSLTSPSNVCLQGRDAVEGRRSTPANMDETWYGGGGLPSVPEHAPPEYKDVVNCQPHPGAAGHRTLSLRCSAHGSLSRHGTLTHQHPIARALRSYPAEGEGSLGGDQISASTEVVRYQSQPWYSIEEAEPAVSLSQASIGSRPNVVKPRMNPYANVQPRGTLSSTSRARASRGSLSHAPRHLQQSHQISQSSITFTTVV